MFREWRRGRRRKKSDKWSAKTEITVTEEDDEEDENACSLNITAAPPSVSTGGESKLIVTCDQCGGESSSDFCSLDVSASGETKDGEVMNPKTDFHVSRESITLFGKENKATFNVSGYQAGTVTVKVGGGSGSCGCPAVQEKIEVKEDGSSSSEMKIKLNTKGAEKMRTELITCAVRTRENTR